MKGLKRLITTGTLCLGVLLTVSMAKITRSSYSWISRKKIKSITTPLRISGISQSDNVPAGWFHARKNRDSPFFSIILQKRSIKRGGVDFYEKETNLTENADGTGNFSFRNRDTRNYKQSESIKYRKRQARRRPNWVCNSKNCNSEIMKLQQTLKSRRISHTSHNSVKIQVRLQISEPPRQNRLKSSHSRRSRNKRMVAELNKNTLKNENHQKQDVEQEAKRRREASAERRNETWQEKAKKTKNRRLQLKRAKKNENTDVVNLGNEYSRTKGKEMNGLKERKGTLSKPNRKQKKMKEENNTKKKRKDYKKVSKRKETSKANEKIAKNDEFTSDEPSSALSEGGRSSYSSRGGKSVTTETVVGEKKVIMPEKKEEVKNKTDPKEEKTKKKGGDNSKSKKGKDSNEEPISNSKSSKKSKKKSTKEGMSKTKEKEEGKPKERMKDRQKKTEMDKNVQERSSSSTKGKKQAKGENIRKKGELTDEGYSEKSKTVITHSKPTTKIETKSGKLKKRTNNFANGTETTLKKSRKSTKKIRNEKYSMEKTVGKRGDIVDSKEKGDGEKEGHKESALVRKPTQKESKATKTHQKPTSDKYLKEYTNKDVTKKRIKTAQNPDKPEKVDSSKEGQHVVRSRESKNEKRKGEMEFLGRVFGYGLRRHTESTRSRSLLHRTGKRPLTGGYANVGRLARTATGLQRAYASAQI